MRRCLTLILALALVSGAPDYSPADAAEPSISLELITEEGFPGVEMQRWLKAFTDQGLRDVQIRPWRGGDEPKLSISGKGDSQNIHAIGILTPRNELVLPGQRFGRASAATIVSWIKKQGQSQGDAPVETPFGLSPGDYKQLRQALKAPVEFETRGMTAVEAVDKLTQLAGTPTKRTTSVDAALAECDPVGDELKGLAVGASLAAVLRPAGLALKPRSSGGRVELLIGTNEETAAPGWPIGLPLEKKEENALVPGLVGLLEIEVSDQPIQDVVDAFAARLKVPALYDYNALAHHNIDPAERRVTLPSRKTSYGVALMRLCSRAKLKYEVRADDAGTPFIWITSLHPVK